MDIRHTLVLLTASALGAAVVPDLEADQASETRPEIIRLHPLETTSRFYVAPSNWPGHGSNLFKSKVSADLSGKLAHRDLFRFFVAEGHKGLTGGAQCALTSVMRTLPSGSAWV